MKIMLNSDQRGNETVTIDRWAVTVGDGRAGVDKKGTLWASSSGSGKAGEGYHVNKKPYK
jgi:hypothetical protein